MSRKSLYVILFIWVLNASAYGRHVTTDFDEVVFDSYSKACDLNDAKNYLEAFRFIQLADQSIDEYMMENGLEASMLDDGQFRYPLWAVKKSKAEIAYMLGLHTEIQAISNELSRYLKSKIWEEGDGVEDIKKGLWADLSKIDGDNYYLTGKYDSCEVSLRRALRLGGFYGNEDFICKVHDDLAQLYYKQGTYDMALAHLDTVLASPLYQTGSRNKVTEQNIKTVQSQRALCLARLGYYKEARKEIEHLLRYFHAQGDIRSYAECLRKKAKILMLQYDATGKYNPAAAICYRQYLDLSRDYIDSHFVHMSESQREQYWMAEQPFASDCFRLEDKAPDFLYDVALYSKAVLLQMGREFKEDMTLIERKNALASIRVNWRQVRDKLPCDGCAIEFITYEKQGERHIGALVLNAKSAYPEFVAVGRVSSISDYWLAEGLTVKDVFCDTKNKGKINCLYNDSTLRRLVWNDKLVRAIGDCDKVYFSPDGIFHQMGIEYMTPASLEKKRLYRLTTTRLIIRPLHKPRIDNMLICGGVEYSSSEEDLEKGNDALAYSLLASMDQNITCLPYSAIEIDSIMSVRKNHSADIVLRADSLTESELNRLMGKYHIAHISTHGLFPEVAKIGTDIRPSSADTQLSGSCLLLSGAGKNLKIKDFDASHHDGILSARELAKMDLGNVDLTVLSACMSGLGYVTPDGVYGLQRGLKTAGVDAIVSTLWSVDDEASCLFIIQLYKNLETGMTVSDAFWAAREALRKYEKSYGVASSSNVAAKGIQSQSRRITVQKFNKPYYLNAFILIDGLK